MAEATSSTTVRERLQRFSAFSLNNGRTPGEELMQKCTPSAATEFCQRNQRIFLVSDASGIRCSAENILHRIIRIGAPLLGPPSSLVAPEGNKPAAPRSSKLYPRRQTSPDPSRSPHKESSPSTALHPTLPAFQCPPQATPSSFPCPKS